MTSELEFLTDYHMHSTYSPDGHASIDELCRRSLDLGMDTIAITDHLEWRSLWGSFRNAGSYMRELEKKRQKYAPLGLTVLSGVEMGNPHDHSRKAQAFLRDHPVDVRIASLHWLYGENIHLEACFKGRDPQIVYRDYFNALGRMVSDFEEIDIVAHFDRIIMRGALLGTPLDPQTLEPTIRQALAAVAARDVALELNTRMLDHAPNWRPALTTMLQWYKEEGGTRLVVDSDSHRLEHLGSNLDLAAEVLDQVGLKPDRLRVRSLSPA